MIQQQPAFTQRSGEPQKVFVGMSGGVDSSVSAALLQSQGYDVTGVFIKVWHPDWLPCDWRDERRDAMRVAAHLDIPFLTFDFEEEYKKGVADYMIEEYKKGRTPNPDVMCNKEIKFGAFFNKAREMGADFIATGHYAQNINAQLVEGADKNKDQSYFLWTLSQAELKHVLFPVGNLEKEHVRKLAKKYALPTAEKKDSQGICFLGTVDMKEFLSHYIKTVSGNVIDETTGKIIGTHDDAIFYTAGQRHGFHITQPVAEHAPYYVTRKNISDNTIFVSQKKNPSGLSNPSGLGQTLKLSSPNWIGGRDPDTGKRYGARIRYRQPKQECTLEIKGNVASVTFEHAQDGVSAGQSLVLYEGETCLGGGIIEQVTIG